MPSFVAFARLHVRPLSIEPAAIVVAPVQPVGPAGGVTFAAAFWFGTVIGFVMFVQFAFVARLTAALAQLLSSTATAKLSALHAVPVDTLHAHVQLPVPVPVTVLKSVGVSKPVVHGGRVEAA